MSRARHAAILLLAAPLLSACGMAVKPRAGSAKLASSPGFHARLQDPRTKHVACMRADHLPISLYQASGNRPAIRIGAGAGSPIVIFEPTPGAAQGLQITGHAQAAEVIGSALLYPNRGSDAELATIENCLAIGVVG